MTKSLTLTFDNGPFAEVTPQVLRVLEAKEVSATFFMLGERLALPDGRPLAESVSAAGHWIGNHTWSHSTPFGRQPSDEVVEHEIRGTQALIDGLATNRRMFRPKGDGGLLGDHLLSPKARDILLEDGFTMVLWNSIPRDWEQPDDWVETALEHCEAQEWTVMVLHDTPTGAMRHLGRFIDEARDRGIEFTQEISPGCMPITDGRVVAPITQFVGDPGAV